TRQHGSCDFFRLPEDFGAVVLQRLGHGGDELFLDVRIVGTRRKGQSDFTPAKIDPGYLLEQTARYLKDPGIPKGGGPAGRPPGPFRAEFHQIHSNQPEVDDLAGNLAYLYPVADADAVFTDQEKITDDGYENTL